MFPSDPANPYSPPLVYHIYSDHLDTPRVVTDRNNVVRWRWMGEPFGSTAPETNPAGLGVFTQNLRYPGQYADAESGLHYNTFRDYDATTGRYVQSDPIGLQGGINTYGYVKGNPLRFTDPTGENPLLIGLGVAAAFYYGTDQLGSLLEAKWKVEELKQLVDIKNSQLGCINSGGRSCGDLRKTEQSINKCARESVPVLNDAGYSGIKSADERAIDLIRKLSK